jgi:hypothetical protein
MTLKNLLVATFMVAIFATTAAKAQGLGVILTDHLTAQVNGASVSATFSGGAGSTDADFTLSGFPVPAPNGGAIGILASANGVAGGTITLDLSSITSGEITLSWAEQASFAGYYQWTFDPVTVSYGGVDLGTYTETKFNDWDHQSLTFAANGSDVTFSGALAPTGYTYISGISGITVTSGGGIGGTPELSTSLMMTLAGLGLGFVAWRRRGLAA